jgi:hypothetical protein
MAVVVLALALVVGAYVSRTAGLVLALIGLAALLTVRRTPLWDRMFGGR